MNGNPSFSAHRPIALLATAILAIAVLWLAYPRSLAAQVSGGPSAFCHLSDGLFTSCPGGGSEWSDIPFAAFPASNSFLYADQADLNPAVQSVNPVTGATSPLDTFVLMYDECNRTAPLGPNEYFLVNFDTVELEGGLEKLERYTVHLFTDGTLIFFENGQIQTDAQGRFRVTEIEGQRGRVGFGPSPTCPFNHVIAEYQIVLDTAGGNSYSPDPLFWGATPPECTVTISPASGTMNLGEMAQFMASDVPGGSYQWTIDGAILKDYDETVRTGYQRFPMEAADFRNKSIAFYWQPPTGARTVRVDVTAGDQSCNDTKMITVEKSTNIDKQAEDFFNKVQTGPGGRSHNVLREHASYHIGPPMRTGREATYDGAYFFNFHHDIIDRFNKWRSEFGFAAVGLWNPGSDPLPTDADGNHMGRSAYNPATSCTIPGQLGSCAKPSWFTVAGAAAARPDNPASACDAPAGQMKLTDFPLNRNLLGCAATDPWHNVIHGAVGGDMRNPTIAPRDPIFWRWHNFLDGVSQDRMHSPPQLISQTPFESSFITMGELGSISVSFSEPVTGITPTDLTVNGVPATGISGSGAGPYVFTGFTEPAVGQVTVVLASGAIVDLDEGFSFEGKSWTYSLVDPTLDADNDGLNDGEEVRSHMTNPTLADTDGDGLPDSFEVRNTCLNPVADQAHPHDFAGDPLPGEGDDDADDDGITDMDEFLNGTNPCSFTFVPGANAIRPGFNAQILPGNDDGSTALVPIGFPVNFLGASFNALFVNNNGNLTFDAPLGEFTPFDLTSTNRVIVAPFFADVDTSSSAGIAAAAVLAAEGNPLAYGTGNVDGHPAFGATWPGVGCFANITTVLNYFQVILIDRSDIATGDFDIEFNFDRIQWEAGTASGGDATCQGGTSARAGYSNGTGLPGTFFELPGSGIVGAFLDTNPNMGLIHGSLNSAQPGRYLFRVRNGTPDTSSDADGDQIPDDRDNCPGVANTDQADSDLNGIGNACQTPDTRHSTAGFLQALLNGGTTAEASGLKVSEEPSNQQRLVPIVDFREATGLTGDPMALTENLVDSLVEAGLAAPAEAPALVNSVLNEAIGPAAMCDADRDGNIDIDDIQIIFNARNTPAFPPPDARDANQDNTVTTTDSRACSLQCTLPKCARVQP